MENQELIRLIRRELPDILRRDPEMRAWVLQLTQERYADRAQTENRIERMLEEIRQMREEHNRKWEENQRELRAMREEQARKWEEQARKWEEQARKWEEQNRRWEENQRELRAMREETSARFDRILGLLEAQARKHDSAIGALGARWGLRTEQSFRNALKGILENSFGVEVINLTEYDDAGEVFGRPDQVELDVIIKDGTLILCEIKSSMSKADMYIFERKGRFYEKRHNRKAARMLVISPMVDEGAREVAAALGIEVYSYAEETGPALQA
ncbi:MAG: DUF3782 domain-containing protein [Caldilineae bacterium]|nr:MAG: DUF3782 domain-containing protein [Caldilineae bacterium]